MKNYFFYGIYNLYGNSPFENHFTPGLYSLVVVTVIQSINIVSLSLTYCTIYGIDFFEFFSRKNILIFYSVLMLVNYIRYFKISSIEDYESRWSQETKSIKKKYLKNIFLYVILTFSLLILTAICTSSK